MKRYEIAVVPGDGIGPEVVSVCLDVLELLAAKHGIEFQWRHFDWGCEYFLREGRMMPEDGLERLRPHDAILLGAVGYPGVPDHVSLWGLLVPIRRKFDQYVNMRPVKLLPGVRSPLSGRDVGSIDMVIIRENVEGEYSQVGGRLYEGTDQEFATQSATFTRHGVDRIMRFAFELASTRAQAHVSSATKSNGIVHTMPFWDERFEQMAAQFPTVRADKFHIDILTAHFVQHPDWFDVVVASNLFGDILSDLGSAVAGGIGLAPSANLNPEREYPSMFEPVHGSAPDIAGKGVANPIATLWSASLMLDFLGENVAALELAAAIEHVTGEVGLLTPDLGGKASTRELGEAVKQAVATGS